MVLDSASYIITYEMLTGPVLKYKEPMPTFKWELLSKRKTLLNYQCQKSVCTFRGRTYLILPPPMQEDCGFRRGGALPLGGASVRWRGCVCPSLPPIGRRHSGDSFVPFAAVRQTFRTRF